MRSRGFTLIEVMVALFVIALGVGALLATLVTAADTVAYLREKSFAQWIAFNRIAEVRLASSSPEAGTTSDVVEYAGANWRWEQQIAAAGIGDLWRINVRVSRVGAADGSDAAKASSAQAPTLATAVGFLANGLTRASGSSPEWSQRAPSSGSQGGAGTTP